MKKTAAFKRSHILIRKKQKEPLISQTSLVIIISCFILTVSLGTYHVYVEKTEAVDKRVYNRHSDIKGQKTFVEPMVKKEYQPAEEHDPEITKLEQQLSEVGNLLEEK